MYAINVTKVVEILVYKDLNVIKNSDSSLVRGTAKIRDEMATVINFDEWFENEVLDDSEYEYLIFTAFGGYNLGIMVHSVEYIITADSSKMKDNSMNNQKTNFIAEIKLNSQDRLCTIFDSDRLLVDIFHEINSNNNIKDIKTSNIIESNKVILFADDSHLIQNMVRLLFEKLSLKYKIFGNGQELLDELMILNVEEVGLIITDLEMPVMDGLHLVKAINDTHKYDDISIIIHSNMSNFMQENTFIELGVDEVIAKVNMQKLSQSISKYLKR